MQQYWCLLILVVLVGFYRFHNGLLDNPLDWDEANMLAISQLPLPEIYRVVAIRDIHPPGFEVLLHGWIGMFGKSIEAVRALPWVLGLCGVVAAHALSLNLYRCKKTALLTALLVGLNPYLLKYHRLALPYAFLFTGSLVSWYLLLRLIGHKTEKKFWMKWEGWAHFLVTFWVIQSQALGFLLIVMQGGYILYLQFKKRNGQIPLGLTGLFGIEVLSLLPYFWLLCQYWHASHLPEMRLNHAMIPLLTLVMSPGRWIFMGDDRFTPPATEGEFLTALLGMGLMGIALWGAIPLLRAGGGGHFMDGLRTSPQLACGRMDISNTSIPVPNLDLCHFSRLFYPLLLANKELGE